MEEKAAREAVAAREQQKLEENINIQQLERLAQDYYVDEKQIVTYWNAFKSYDGDESGDIDAPELRKLLRDLGLQLGQEEIEDIIREVDTIGRGTIPFGKYEQNVVLSLTAYLKRRPQCRFSDRSLLTNIAMFLCSFVELMADPDGPLARLLASTVSK
eukprot:497233-Rhodomonas_salina.1